MKYKVGDNVWVWRMGDMENEPHYATITGYSGKASFNEDVYEFEYSPYGFRCSSGAGESDLYATEDAAKLARFKMARTFEDIFNQIENVVILNKELMSELKHKLYEEYSASR